MSCKIYGYKSVNCGANVALDPFKKSLSASESRNNITFNTSESTAVLGCWRRQVSDAFQRSV